MEIKEGSLDTLYSFYFPAKGQTNLDVSQPKTFLIPREIIPHNFSLLGFAVSEELGNKQTDRQTDSLTDWCFYEVMTKSILLCIIMYQWLRHYICSGFCQTSYHLLISPPPAYLPNTLKIHTGENKLTARVECGASIHAIFQLTVRRIQMFFSLKPSQSQGESSLKISARWGSPFRRSQGTNKHTHRQTHSLTDRLALLQSDILNYLPIRCNLEPVLVLIWDLHLLMTFLINIITFNFSTLYLIKDYIRRIKSNM